MVPWGLYLGPTTLPCSSGMVAFINRGTPMYTPKYYNPYCTDSKEKVPLVLGSPYMIKLVIVVLQYGLNMILIIQDPVRRENQ